LVRRSRPADEEEGDDDDEAPVLPDVAALPKALLGALACGGPETSVVGVDDANLLALAPTSILGWLLDKESTADAGDGNEEYIARQGLLFLRALNGSKDMP
jgi:hypothetical protein